MIFHAYGLFWQVDEIDWKPGAGNKGKFRLLGRRGVNRSKLEVADFRRQVGIYILYGNYGPYYVGLTRRRSLGGRLKDHLKDKHAGNWDRFSWFGFHKVLKKTDEFGLQKLRPLAEKRHLSRYTIIGDTEALLIKAMALKNIADMKFRAAKEWHQIKRDEVDYYLGKL
jgi:hypothetical protein